MKTGNTNVWEFHHVHFLRDQVNELVRIRKNDKLDQPATKEEVQDIRNDVAELRETVLEMQSSMEQLKDIFSSLVPTGSVKAKSSSSCVPKRKVHHVKPKTIKRNMGFVSNHPQRYPPSSGFRQQAQV